jgi:hypothetical protein
MSLNELCLTRNYSAILQYCKLNELDAIGECIANHIQYTRRRLSDFPDDDLQKYITHFTRPRKDKIRVMPLCNWTNTFSLVMTLSRLLPPSARIQFVVSNPEYWLVLNSPLQGFSDFDRSKTIVYQMEPYMERNPIWGEWSVPDSTQFLEVNTHATTLNAIEWHVSPTAKELLTLHPEKNDTLPLSTIQSDKYLDPGQVLRIDFIKFLEKSGVPVDVYGGNQHKWHDYKGTLPYQKKDDGLFPYKYTFAAENNAIKNYISEKLVDAIVSECLCFYWGCPNVESWIDSKAYIKLDLNDFDGSLEIIRTAMTNQEWEKRLPIIQHEKKRILTELSLAARVDKCITAVHDVKGIQLY